MPSRDMPDNAYEHVIRANLFSMMNDYRLRRFVLCGRKGGGWGLHPRREPGIYDEMPWVPCGQSRLPFPVAIECPTSTDAEYLFHGLQLVASSWTADCSIAEVLLKIDKSAFLEEVAISIDTKIRFFLVVIVGKSAGIYLSRTLARASLNQVKEKQKYRDLVIYSTFMDALKGLLTGGKHDGGKLLNSREVPAEWPATGRPQDETNTASRTEAKGLAENLNLPENPVLGENTTQSELKQDEAFEDESFSALDEQIRALDWNEGI
ncbi:hypothetical protein C8J56DRAFT_1059734 [Mycena floridula]|nr:hypothetical protein C8J56DRAFT_1059734 [Mycena floridula]